MKILIVTSVAWSWPYVPEMVGEFKSSGSRVEVFDIDDCGRMGLSAKVAFRIPKLRYYTTVALLKRRLAQFPKDFDAVNIQFAAPIYSNLATQLKRQGKKLVTSIWGSEFLRAGPSALRDLGRTFRASDIITTNNPEILQRLIARYPYISSRARVVPFGLRSLDVIAKLQASETQTETRARLDIPAGKVVVTCGYNAMREQGHGTIIEALAALSTTAKSRLFTLFPMTYPDDRMYRAQVDRAMGAAQVDYRILDKKLTIEEIARVRIASDYAVNMQTTDSLSASLQEHMFAGSSMIVAKWLPYDIFERMGIRLQRVESAKEISTALEKAVLGTPGNRSKPAYAEKLYDYSSWSSNTPRWLSMYTEHETATCVRGPR